MLDTLPTDWVTCSKDALGRGTFYTYWIQDDVDAELCDQAVVGSVKRVKTPDNIVTHTEYNGYAQPTEVTVDERAEPKNLNLKSTFLYDASGNRTSSTVPFGDSGTAITLYEYDANGDLTKIKDPLYEEANPSLRTTEFTYYPSTRDMESVTRRVVLNWDEATPTVTELQTVFFYDAFGNATSVEDAGGRVTDFVYDNADRLTRTTLPAPVSEGTRPEISYAYDLSGNLTTVTDPFGHDTVSFYGLDNELEAVEIPIDDGVTATTQYFYDDQLRLTQVQDAEIRTTNYSFDNLGRLTGVGDPFGRRTEYTFDGIDRLTSQTDAKGQETFFEYDPITDGLTKQTFQDDNESPWCAKTRPSCLCLLR